MPLFVITKEEVSAVCLTTGNLLILLSSSLFYFKTEGRKNIVFCASKLSCLPHLSKNRHRLIIAANIRRHITRVTV